MKDLKKHKKLRASIFGASHTNSIDNKSLETAKKLGKSIALDDISIHIGTTIGFPMWVAKEARKNNGIAISYSPAKDIQEHQLKYRLPYTEEITTIFTGMDKAVKNNIVAYNSDFSIFGPLSVDSIQEISIALAENKPIGIIEGNWNIDTYKEIIQAQAKSNQIIHIHRDPQSLVSQLIKTVRTL